MGGPQPHRAMRTVRQHTSRDGSTWQVGTANSMAPWASLAALRASLHPTHDSAQTVTQGCREVQQTRPCSQRGTVYVSIPKKHSSRETDSTSAVAHSTTERNQALTESPCRKPQGQAPCRKPQRQAPCRQAAGTGRRDRHHADSPRTLQRGGSQAGRSHIQKGGSGGQGLELGLGAPARGTGLPEGAILGGSVQNTAHASARTRFSGGSQ